MRKHRLKNYLKLGILLFGISFVAINCQIDQNVVLEETKSISAKTVSFEDAKAFFKNNNKSNLFNKGQSGKKNNNLILNPDWNSLAHHDIYDMEPKLTLADVSINRVGNYSSDLFFIEINGEIENVIFTIYKRDVTDNGNIINATMYFNKTDGEFIDGFEIENGKFTKRYVIEKNLQQAIFLPFFQNNVDNTCWNTDNLPEDGRLGEVDLGTIRSNGGGGSTFDAGLYSTLSMINFLSNTDGTGGSSSPSGGGGTTGVAGNIFVKISETNSDGSDDDDQNKCENEGKLYNEKTKQCECPEGKTEDKDGNCVDVNDDDDDCDTSKEDLKKIFPNASDSDMKTLAHVLNEKGKDFGINSDEDLWHFLSQAGHETGGFKTLNVTESTYWTTANKLASTYSRFTMDSTKAKKNVNLYYAPDYLKNSSGVANIAMCCKYGNGDVSSGDGYKYRGRGLFQLTWKDNYLAFKNWYNNKYDPDIDPVTSPSIIASNDTLAILSGLWYYKTRVDDKIAIDSTTTVDKITLKVNGKKKKGLADRKQRFKKAKDSINCL